METNSGSKALWSDQCDHEIDADGERDGEAKHGFEHDSLSDAGYEPRIKRKKPKGGEPQCQEDDVGHGYTSVWIEASLMQPRRVSIRSGMRSFGIRIS